MKNYERKILKTFEKLDILLEEIPEKKKIEIWKNISKLRKLSEKNIDIAHKFELKLQKQNYKNKGKK